jgi:hypothetical protein
MNSAFDMNGSKLIFVFENDLLMLPFSSPINVSVKVMFEKYPGLFSASSAPFSFSISPPPPPPRRRPPCPLGASSASPSRTAASASPRRRRHPLLSHRPPPTSARADGPGSRTTPPTRRRTTPRRACPTRHPPASTPSTPRACPRPRPPVGAATPARSPPRHQHPRRRRPGRLSRRNHYLAGSPSSVSPSTSISRGRATTRCPPESNALPPAAARPSTAPPTSRAPTPLGTALSATCFAVGRARASFLPARRTPPSGPVTA